MQIKFVDLVSQTAEIRERVERELVKIHLDAGYIGGPQVKAFEEEFAAYLGVRHVISVGNGTDAIRLALLAVGVGPGSEVITTPMTFIATAAAIRQTGARPTLVDIDPETCNIDPHALRRYLVERRRRSPHGLRAIVPVHLYGLPAAMREIQEIAVEFGLRIVEDACQAHGASFHDGQRWRYAGTLGAAGCFSFYPGKNLGAWGDGGAAATDDDELADRIRMLRDHGRISHYAHQDYGYNSRLDAIQAAVLRAKLERLPDWNRRRREIAESYRELLDGADLVLPTEPEGLASAYQQEYRVWHSLSRAAASAAGVPRSRLPAQRFSGERAACGHRAFAPDASASERRRSAAGGRNSARGSAQASHRIRRRASPKPSRLCSPPGAWRVRHVRRRTTKTESAVRGL
jgi:dTDP-4-amino-4,6-dideoxygalactose transaminase